MAKHKKTSAKATRKLNTTRKQALKLFAAHGTPPPESARKPSTRPQLWNAANDAFAKVASAKAVLTQADEKLSTCMNLLKAMDLTGNCPIGRQFSTHNSFVRRPRTRGSSTRAR